MKISDKTRHRLAIQGYEGINDKELSEAALWIKFAPGVCAVWAATGTFMASYTVIWALAPLALLGAIFPYHPFDSLYNFVIRHFLGRKALPKNGAPRRFSCALGSVWLFAVGFSFYTGLDLLGAALGYSMVAVATLVTTTDFCIPSGLYRRLFSPLKKLEVEV